MTWHDMTLHYITTHTYIHIYTYVCVDNEISVYIHIYIHIYIYICNHMYLDVLLSNIIYAKSPCFPRYHRNQKPVPPCQASPWRTSPRDAPGWRAGPAPGDPFRGVVKNVKNADVNHEKLGFNYGKWWFNMILTMKIWDLTWFNIIWHRLTLSKVGI